MVNIGCGYIFVFCEMVNAVGILAKESSGLAAPSRIIEPLRGTRAMLIIIALMPRTWLVFMAAWRPTGLLRPVGHSRDSRLQQIPTLTAPRLTMGQRMWAMEA